MIAPPEEGCDHPGNLELRHYARGSLQRDHAAAILAHAVSCPPCAARLSLLLPGGDGRRLLLGRDRELLPGA